MVAKGFSMDTSAVSPSSPTAPAPAGARVTPTLQAPKPVGKAPGEGLDLEEDVAPNLGGEDRMQDA